MQEDTLLDFIDSYNALISFFLHVPFPEKLTDDEWIEKARQIDWLEAKGILQQQFIKRG